MTNCKDIITEFLKERGSTSLECSGKVGWKRSNLYDKYRRNTFYVSDLDRIANAYGYEVEIRFKKAKPSKEEAES